MAQWLLMTNNWTPLPNLTARQHLSLFLAGLMTCKKVVNAFKLRKCSRLRHKWDADKRVTQPKCRVTRIKFIASTFTCDGFRQWLIHSFTTMLFPFLRIEVNCHNKEWQIYQNNENIYNNYSKILHYFTQKKKFGKRTNLKVIV